MLEENVPEKRESVLSLPRQEEVSAAALLLKRAQPLSPTDRLAARLVVAVALLVSAMPVISFLWFVWLFLIEPFLT